MLCDLHTHSLYSDGTCTPEQLLKAAEESSVAALALTDHNTTAGLPAFLAAAGNYAVEPVCGVELSSDYEGTELHILALFLPTSAFSEIERVGKACYGNKEQSNLELIERLGAAGYTLDYEEIRARTETGRVNRAHIAAMMVEKGYVSSIGAAFDDLLSEKRGFYVPRNRLRALEAVELIQSLGALPILAHPLLNLNYDRLEKFLQQAKAAGLVAMETEYSLFNSATSAKLREIACGYGLLCSGGSDFHGDNKPDIQIGTGRGGLYTPYSYFLELKERHAQLFSKWGE